ncbi:hypothetical protein PR048_012081 [Dryococelus australis]|uniref:Uncharacterized protein n=1 Tax=Dryococelus australis TaxID=614101 RepID=A0ABQ9HNL0_9NEOP|nr:hypothetical protein PR048_012081 [Dryococelus australis]
MSYIKTRNIITQCLADNVLESVMDKITAKEGNKKFQVHWGSLEDFINVFKNTTNELKSSVVMWWRDIDIIFSKHPDDVDLNYVKNVLLLEELQQRLVAFNSKKKFDSNSERKFSLRKHNVSSTSYHQGCEFDGDTIFVAANRDQNVNKQCLVSNSSTISFVVDLGASNHMINK